MLHDVCSVFAITIYRMHYKFIVEVLEKIETHGDDRSLVRKEILWSVL